MTANSHHRLVLASASPRRRELLVGLGLEPEIRPARIDESPRPGEEPPDLVLRLARTKAERIADELTSTGDAYVVLAADTAVVVDDVALGKPSDVSDAESMLQRLRGRCHEVLTGVWLVRTDDGRCAGGVAGTGVEFRDFDDDWLRAYARSGEPLDKAGAYAIQGRGALLVARIDGSWSNVVGLPLERLPEWIGGLGLSLLELCRLDPPGNQSTEASLP